jgi:hypothetical protein
MICYMFIFIIICLKYILLYLFNCINKTHINILIKSIYGEREDLLQGLTHTVMEVIKKSHDLPLVTCRTRKACRLMKSESEALRTRVADDVIPSVESKA